jgi:hypothetical protein
VVQLLRCSRHSGTARSTVADIARAESGGTRQHEDRRTRRGNGGAGGVAVWTGRMWSTRVGGSCGLGPF